MLCRTMARTTTIMSMAQASAAMTAVWRLLRHELWRELQRNFQEGDAYEKMQFYYHPDHLGSSSYITNLNGEVCSILSMYHCMKPCYRHLKLGGFTIGEYRPI